ncbi:MAG: MgtC/SapB family protein [Bacteroidia bacterium]|nr:MgtC/SapB family protein [Bacteroidia bacterium]
MEWIREILCDNTVNASTVTFRLLLSLILGIIIGGERGLRGRDAGLRTFTLIVLGSTVAMILSIWIPQIYPNFLNGDPGRIAAQVITGIGFLGAGAIVRGKGSIQGLTTAACIWTSAVIGMAVGAGLYSGAIIATALTLFVLVGTETFEQRVFHTGINRIMTIGCAITDPDVKEIKKIIEECGISTGGYTYSINYEIEECSISLKVIIKSVEDTLAVSKILKERLPYIKSINMVA